MIIDKHTIDIAKLVSAIHEAEANRPRPIPHQSPKDFTAWRAHVQARKLGDLFGGTYFCDYTSYVTSLYTLRAWLRGKLHRLNPPASLRDTNRTYGRPDDDRWDAKAHNGRIAEKTAPAFARPVDVQPEAAAV